MAAGLQLCHLQSLLATLSPALFQPTAALPFTTRTRGRVVGCQQAVSNLLRPAGGQAGRLPLIRKPWSKGGLPPPYKGGLLPPDNARRMEHPGHSTTVHHHAG